MNNQDEWGPWITHDGKGCPCLGQMVEFLPECHIRGILPSMKMIAGSGGGFSWDWNNFPECTRIISYRIRKPLGLTMLEAIARDIKTPIVKVDA